jgi:hypothetical protein
MKHKIGMAAAAVLVLLQLGVVAAWSVEPPLDLSPVEDSELVPGQHA